MKAANTFYKNCLVYPNPTTAELHIDGNNKVDLTNTQVIITNTQGQIVKNIQLLYNNNTIALQDIATGIYLLQLKKDNVIVHTQKLTITQ